MSRFFESRFTKRNRFSTVNWAPKTYPVSRTLVCCNNTTRRPRLGASKTSAHRGFPFAMDRMSSPEGQHAHAGPLQSQLTSESSYGLRNGHGLPLHTSMHFRQDPVPSYPNFHQPMKGAPYEGSPGFRAHMGYPLLNRFEHIPVSRSLPPVSDSTISVTQMAKNTPPVGEGVVLKAPHSKAHRATQVCSASRRRDCFGRFSD